MKILKNLLIALAVIVVVGGIVLYFLPNHYTVTNSIEINKPADVVYAQISDEEFENDIVEHENWNAYE